MSYETNIKRRTHDLLKPSGLITAFFMTKLPTGPIAALVDRQSKKAEKHKRGTDFNITVSSENYESILANMPLDLKVWHAKAVVICPG
jgi:hypothetical protein